ncbi:MAG TPA: PaaI family thioesterase [Flavisolibacter sp.]|nr:PaaI family thioesterase [Flavisolibacter sp.]
MPLSQNKINKVRESFSRSPLMNMYGAQLTDVHEGFAELTLEKKVELLRTSGSFHGGVIAALADTAGGYAAAATAEEDVYLVTVEFKINYLREARGEAVIAKARVVKNGKRLVVVTADIYARSEHGDVHVAIALLTFMHVRKRS